MVESKQDLKDFPGSILALMKSTRYLSASHFNRILQAERSYRSASPATIFRSTSARCCARQTFCHILRPLARNVRRL